MRYYFYVVFIPLCITRAKSNTVPVGSTGNRSHALEGEVNAAVGNALGVADGTADGGDHPGFCIGRELHRKGSAAGFQNCGYCLIQRCCIGCIVGVRAIGDDCDHGHVSAADTLAGGNIQGVSAQLAVACTAVFADCQSGAGRRAAGVFALAGSIFLEQTAQRAVFYDLIRRGGIQSGITADGAVLYRTTIAAVNAAGSVSVTGFISQISDIIRIRVISKGVNLRI